MKRISVFAVAASLLAVCSCSNKMESPAGQIEPGGARLTAYTESRESRTSVVDGGTEVFWNTEDEIKVFSGESSGKFVSLNSELALSAEFAGPSGFSFKSGEDIAAVYPYSEDATWDGEAFTVTLPSEQVACPGTFARGMNISVASSSDSDALQFYNVCGGVRFSVAESGVTKVVVKGLGEESIAGTIKVSLPKNGNVPTVTDVISGDNSISVTAPDGDCFIPGEWYYVVAIPGPLQKGFKLVLYKNEDFAVYYHEEVSIKRSIFGTLTDVTPNTDFYTESSYSQKIDEISSIVDVARSSCGDVSDYLRNQSSNVLSCDIVEDFYVDDFHASVSLIDGSSICYPLTEGSIFDDETGYSQQSKPRLNYLSGGADNDSNTSGSAAVTIFDFFSNDASRKNQSQLLKNIRDILTVLGYSAPYVEHDDFTYDRLKKALKQSAVIIISSHGDPKGKCFAINNLNGVDFDLADSQTKIECAGGKIYHTVNVNSLIKQAGNQLRFIYFATCNTLSEKRASEIEKTISYANKKLCVAGWDGNVKAAEAYALFLADYAWSSGMDWWDFAEDFNDTKGRITDPLVSGSHLVFKGNTTVGLSEIRLDQKGRGWKRRRGGENMNFYINSPETGDRIKHAALSSKYSISCECYYPNMELEKGYLPDGNDHSLIVQNMQYSAVGEGSDTYLQPNTISYQPLFFKRGKVTCTVKDLQPGVAKLILKNESTNTIEDCSYVLVSNKFEKNEGETFADMPAPEIETISASYDGNETTFSCAVVNMDGSSLEKGVCYWKENSPNDKITVKSNDRSSNYFVKVYNLDSTQRYVVCGYAVGEDGVTYYGNNLNFSPGWMTPPETMEYVDLGLPSGLKWATCNLGASKPEGYGDYYAWGETQTKSVYSWTTYKWCNGSDHGLTKYNANSSYGSVDNKATLEPDDDVAHAKLGGNWRMPTDSEWDELLDNCNATWTTINGVNGQLLTSKKNGNSIFLPAAGDISPDSGLNGVGIDGNYWSSSLYSANPSMARTGYFYSSSIMKGSSSRDFGQSVRPVYSDGNNGQQCEAVDLGLSVKWASCNLGASKPEEYGDYYAWGATEPWYEAGYAQEDPQNHWKSGKSEGYSWVNCPFNGGNSEYNESYWTSYKSECVDGNGVLLPENDAAHVRLGGNWRIPTKEECDELVGNCDFEHNIIINGIIGAKLTSRKNGNSIFLPGAGCRIDVGRSYDGWNGEFYWSSSIMNDRFYGSRYAFVMNFYLGNELTNRQARYLGFSIRPVSE